MKRLVLALAAVLLSIPVYAQTIIPNSSGGGGGGTPGGSNTQLQYNNAGSFGGITGATTNGTAVTLVAPVLGTPASGVATNLTGLPLTTGVTGVLPVANGGSNCSSASITCFNNITGFTASSTTGITSTNLVFSTSPTLVTPTLGVAAGTSLALGGATIGGNALAVTGTSLFSSTVTVTQGTANTNLFASTGGSNTGSGTASAVDLAWTLNTSGSPDVFALRVTDTARGASTKLVNVYGGASGTTSEWNLDRTGAVVQLGGLTLAAGSNGSPSINFTGATTTGFRQGTYNGGGAVLVDVGGLTQWAIEQSGNGVFQIGPVGWAAASGGSLNGTTPDLFLLRDAANTLALRNGANAQTARVYGTFTDSSNGDWLSLTKAAGGTATISTVANGTGTGGDLIFGVPVTAGAGVATTNVWKIGAGASAGALLAVSDNTYDIGASGATRPRNLYVANSITVGASMSLTATALNVPNGGTIGSAGRGYWNFPSDGVWTFQNNAGTDFGRLQFGGTTSSFPAFARNSANIDVVLADNSTFTSIGARGLIAKGAVPTLTLSGGTCAGSVISGGSTAGTITVTGVCVATNTLALTVMPTAPTGYVCDAVDRTLGTTLLGQTATTTTSATFTFSGTTGATDVIQYKCIAY